MIKDFATIKEFAPSDVNLTDSFLQNATQKDVDFLNSFNPDKLLFNFRLTAWIPNTKADAPYSGWENTRIGGHTLGHYLAAASQAIARGFGERKGKDGVTLGKRLSYLVESLAECQNALGTGFIFGATMADAAKPELQFDLLEQGTTADTWVPWYTAHKLVNGLVEAWKSARLRTSLTVAERFGEWVYRRVSRWAPETKERVLAVEYGGMNDCLYELYKCAKADGYKDCEHFRVAAEAFDEVTLFKAVRKWDKSCGSCDSVSDASFARYTGKKDDTTAKCDSSDCGTIPDVLNNRHANTTIPKFVGAMNRYITLGDAEYLEYAKSFWNIVVNHHSYITGGNSECEHFGKADVLDAERSNTNCETCNTHNMLKLTRMLFMATGDKKYADYYENTYINAILASVNTDTGMTLYFQPMATGLFKTYCNPDLDKNYFWCCTGTGLENFTKLEDSFYFHTDDMLIVNQYASSSVRWAEKGITLTQKTDLPMTEKVTFTLSVDDCAFGRSADCTANLCDGATGRSADSSPDTTGGIFGDKAASVCSPDTTGETCAKAASVCAPDTTGGIFSLALRIPDWIAAPATVSVNGKSLEKDADPLSEIDASNVTQNMTECRAENGYLVISRDWKDGDTVELSLPAKIVPHTLPDNAGHVFAFKYGPVVLAAELGTEKKYLYQIGIMCDVAGNKYISGQEMTLTGNYGSTSGIKTLPAETIRVKGGSVADFMRDINEHMRRIPGTLHFVLNDTELDDEKAPLVFVPYYLINEKRYGIYWLFEDGSSFGARECAKTDSAQLLNLAQDILDGENGTAPKAATSSAAPDKAASSVDPLSNSTLLQSIGVGYGTQTEGGKDLFPFMQETGTGSVGNPDELTRFAKAGGSFSYMMKVAPEKRNFLVCTLLKADDGKTLCITAGGKTIASITLDSRVQNVSCEGENGIQSGEKYSRVFEIPPEIVEQAECATGDSTCGMIRISFSSATGTKHDETGTNRAKAELGTETQQSAKTAQSARIAAPLEIVYK